MNKWPYPARVRLFSKKESKTQPSILEGTAS